MFEPADPDYAARVTESFGRQRMMDTLGARLVRIAPGTVEIELPVRPELCQQHGFVHAGAVTTIADTACGYAALSLSAPGMSVLSVEFKANFLAPAAGVRLVARGAVKKPGRTLTVCAGDVYAVGAGGDEKLVATMLATMMLMRDRPDLSQG
ncbi:MAG TPA: PaaI family thioesterase [Chloroflexaceae bacterium]|nr:PaaI family thioesterase [Chloroflexaceae bacterium]